MTLSLFLNCSEFPNSCLPFQFPCFKYIFKVFTNGGFTYPKEFSYFLLCEPNAFILNKYFDLNLPITLNSLGYFFISKKEYLQALSIFELNVELYPEAFNTHDSHGEVLLLLGREKEALEAYKRSLELNPENENARELLEKIKA